MEARLGAGADEEGESVRVRIPIAFRVRTDLSELENERVLVRVEAPPGARAKVDGAPVNLDGTGRGAHVVSLKGDTLGPHAETRIIDRRVPYEVELPGGGTHAGHVAVRASITPLVVDGPASHAAVDGARIITRGRTLRGAVLRIGAQAGNVRGDGSFAVEALVPPGAQPTLTVRSHAPGMAPRVVEVPLRRVEASPRGAPGHGP
jgi:hypothetical protein